MKKNKKMLNILLVVLIVILIVISFFITDNKNEQPKSLEVSDDIDIIMSNLEKESAAITSEDKKEFSDINVDTYLQYYEGSDNKIVFIGRPTCHYCQLSEPVVQKISKDYDIEIFYLNTDEFSGDDEERFISSDSFLANGYGTPLLFIISNNKIVDYIDGATDTAHYIEFFEKNNYIA